MINLSNQVAVVTGGSRGIGAAIALKLAEAGANVAIIYRKDLYSAKKIVNQIINSGKKAEYFECNVSGYLQCKSTVHKILKTFGKIDILVNNAGIWEYGVIGKIKPYEWEKTININLTGTFNMCNIVVPHMKKRKYGRIINISSTAGQRGEPFYSHYAASKGGVIAFTKSLSVELIKYNIWVNCVAPGWVLTDMVLPELMNKKKQNSILKSIPRGRFAKPEEIAGPVVFLASSLSDNIVGEIINVNGGSVLCG